MPDLWLPETAKQKKDSYREYSTDPGALKRCPPDKYVVAIAEDVVLSPEEWIELQDYDIVVPPGLPRGEVHLLRKVRL